MEGIERNLPKTGTYKSEPAVDLGEIPQDRTSAVGSPQGWKANDACGVSRGGSGDAPGVSIRRAKMPGKKRRRIRVAGVKLGDAGWNCGDRSDTEPEAVRRRV